MSKKRVQWDIHELAEMVKAIDRDRKQGATLHKAAKKQAAFYGHPIKGVEQAYYRYRSRDPQPEGANEPEMSDEVLIAIPRDVTPNNVAKDVKELDAKLKESGQELDNFYVFRAKRVLVECEVTKTYRLKK
ncbi:MAG: hypothetical protein ABFE07_28000 [Armatimonadia bacterium]